MTCCKSFGICPLFIAAMVAATAAFVSARPAEPPANAKADATAVKGDPYPLNTCPVSGQKLGSMGKPVVKEYDGREVRFCCAACIDGFEKNKAEMFKKIDKQIVESQIKHYPLKTCVVMADEELGDGAVNHVYKNRLVRFCCKMCIETFNENPSKYLAVLDAAVIKQQKAEYPLTTCPVSGKTLDDNAVDYVNGVTLIRFCCNGCVAKFNADPLPVIAKVHEGWMAKHKEGDGHSHDGHSHDGDQSH